MLIATLFLGLLALFHIVHSTPASSTEIQSRGPVSKSTLYCCLDIGQPWQYAYNKYVQVGIDDLKARGGKCAVGAGPRECVDLTCDDYHKITLCNDNKYAIESDCAYLATYAEEIIKGCTRGAVNTPEVCGQLTDSDNYNVIVRWNYELECDGREA